MKKTAKFDKAAFETFAAERNDALLSLDKEKILAYGQKWGVNFNKVPGEEETFWASVHKARTAIPALPMAARVLSKRWLAERGMASMDDGNVPLGLSEKS